MSDGDWAVIIQPAAEHDLQRLPANLRARIRRAIDRLKNGLAQPHLRKLKGHETLWRLTIADDWRVLFDCDTTRRRITILRVLPCGGAYRGL